MTARMSAAHEHVIFRDSVRRYCVDRQRMGSAHESVDVEVTDSAQWREFAQLGWLGILLPTELGGVGDCAEEFAILFEECGRGLVTAPLFGALALGAQALLAADGIKSHEMIVHALANGELRAALAYADAWRSPAVTRLRRDASGYLLNGCKELVLGAPGAALLVVAAEGGVAADRSNALLLIDANSAGVRRTDYRTIDGLAASDVCFDDVRVPAERVLSEGAAARRALHIALDRGRLAACAEMVGAMDALLWMTRDYLRERRQYGAPLAAFQVLQHRMVDMFAELELSRSLLWRAVDELARAPAADGESLFPIAKRYISASARKVAEGAVQLHGALGLSAEFRVAHYFKRLIRLAAALNPAIDASSEALPIEAGQTTCTGESGSVSRQ